MNNVQNDQVVALNCKLENGDILVGILVVGARTTSPQTIVDQDTGLRYRVQLPEELESQGLTVSLDEVKLTILGFD